MHRHILPSQPLTPLIRRGQASHDILPTINPLISLPLLPIRPRNRIDEAAIIRIAEIRNAIPGRMLVGLGRARRLDDAMQRAPNGIVAPARQQIARIDDHGARDGRRVDERPVGGLDLQAAALVLEQERDRAVVGVLAGPDLQRVLAEDGRGHGGVVQEPQGVVAGVGVRVEPGLVEPHGHGDGAHDLDVQGLALVEEGQHEGLEGGVGRGPVVGVGGVALAPDLERLLDVGRGGLERLDAGAVGARADLLAALAGVAAVCLGRGPGDGVFGGLRLGEEGGGGREGGCDAGGGDGQVGEVDEACGLEAGEDGFGGLHAVGGGAVEEFGEVDELGMRG